MKSKTGLHKKIAFIFDGAPSDSSPAESAAAPTAGNPQPSTSARQPQPVPASAQTAPTETATKRTQSKTVRLSKKKKSDPKQLKMQILVGLLSIILVGVLFFVLSTPAASPKKAAAASDSSAQAEQVPITEQQQIIWTRPESWPEEIRDPMTMGTTTQSPAAVGTSTELVVKGIVYSRTRPSAIIGDQIVSVGDTINGIAILAIEKNAVEFEKDGKRWTQQVQR